MRFTIYWTTMTVPGDTTCDIMLAIVRYDVTKGGHQHILVTAICLCFKCAHHAEM